LNEAEKKAEEAWAKIQAGDFQHTATLTFEEILLIGAKQGGVASITGEIGELELDGEGKIEDGFFHVLIAVGSRRSAKMNLFEQQFQNLHSFVAMLSRKASSDG
jgi:hypothetical protein